jgi:hypothetical protein
MENLEAGRLEGLRRPHQGRRDAQQGSTRVQRWLELLQTCRRVERPSAGGTRTFTPTPTMA